MTARAARQVFAIGVSLTLFATLARASLLAALGCYFATLALISAPLVRDAIDKLTPAQLLVLGALLGSPGVAYALRVHDQLIYAEGLHGLATNVQDGLRLSRLPAIAPPLVSADRPQSFFVYAAEDAERVSVQLGPRARSLAGESLGHGLFRIDYDPRRDGPPAPANGALSATLRVGESSYARELRAVTPLAHPRWFCRSPDGALAATPSEETDQLVIVTRDGVRARIPTADGPSDCAFLDDARVLVAHRYAAELWLIDVATGARAGVVAAAGGQTRLAVSPERDLIALALAGTPALQLVDAAALRAIERVELDGAQPEWLAFGPDRDTLIVATRRPAQLLRLTRAQAGLRVAARLPLSRPAVTLARGNGGASVYLAVTDLREHGDAHLGNHFIQDQVLAVDVASLRVTRQWLTARRSPRQSKPGDVDRGISPIGLWQASDGALLAAFAGSEDVLRFSDDRGEPEITELAASALHAPHGVVELSGGTLVVSSPAAGALGFIRDGRLARTLRLAESDSALLARDRVALERRVGERDFYEGTRAGIACQSCHQHAESDDAAHNLGDDRLVPTLSVRGLLGTAPYLRDGSYAVLSDLENVAHGIFRGYLRSQGGRGEALAAYMESLPRAQPAPPPGGHDVGRLRRGFTLFRRAGCADCHTPPAFTSLATLPMHQLFPREAVALGGVELLDVPSLLSVCATPPYLHDGRASTLAAVISDHNRANLHGDTRTLTRAERDDLLAFLCSL